MISLDAGSGWRNLRAAGRRVHWTSQKGLARCCVPNGRRGLESRQLFQIDPNTFLCCGPDVGLCGYSCCSGADFVITNTKQKHCQLGHWAVQGLMPVRYVGD